MRPFTRTVGLSILSIATVLSFVVSVASAATETTLYKFPSSGSKGCYPDGTLLRDGTGALYGTTRGCPISQINTVFKLAPPIDGQTKWVATVLHSFQGGDDGLTPNADLVMDGLGAVYGTTLDAGSHLQGVVFQLLPPKLGETRWQEKVLHAFNYNFAYGIADGAFPGAGLIFDAHGALYGTTIFGGTTADPRAVGFGTVFLLAPPVPGSTAWKETVLYRFKGGFDGEGPSTALTIDGAGVLYGTTISGGKQLCPQPDGSLAGCGTVFRLIPPAPGGIRWTKETLHRFTNGVDGGVPNGKLWIDDAGIVYGTTTQGGKGQCSDGFHVIGCGTVFKLTPPAAGQTVWTEAVLHHFSGLLDGIYPNGGVIQDGAGNLYGTTLKGGNGPCGDHAFRVVGCGVVYKLKPPQPGNTAWTKTTLYNFQGGEDGWEPVGELAANNTGELFGVVDIGTSYNFGAVFQITP